MAPLTLSEARDLLRTYINKFVKPLEKLDEVLEAAQAAQELRVTLERESGELTKHLARLRNEQPSVEAAATKARVEIQDWTQRVATARADAEAMIAKATEQARLAQDRIKTVEAESTQRAETLRRGAAAAHATTTARLEKEINDLSAKKREVEAGLAALRAKF